MKRSYSLIRYVYITTTVKIKSQSDYRIGDIKKANIQPMGAGLQAHKIISIQKQRQNREKKYYSAQKEPKRKEISF